MKGVLILLFILVLVGTAFFAAPFVIAKAERAIRDGETTLGPVRIRVSSTRHPDDENLPADERSFRRHLRDVERCLEEVDDNVADLGEEVEGILGEIDEKISRTEKHLRRSRAVLERLSEIHGENPERMAHVKRALAAHGRQQAFRAAMGTVRERIVETARAWHRHLREAERAHPIPELPEPAAESAAAEEGGTERSEEGAFEEDDEPGDTPLGRWDSGNPLNEVQPCQRPDH